MRHSFLGAGRRSAASVVCPDDFRTGARRGTRAEFPTLQRIYREQSIGGYVPKLVLLPPDPFKTKIVVATIRAGNRRLYSDVRVVAKNDVLPVSYMAEDAGQGSFLTPLILTVDKDEYRAVVFTENGERAGVVRLKQTS